MGSQSNEVDLNHLRDLVKRGQRKQNDASVPVTQQVFVDKGKIVVGEDVADRDSRALTRIDTETPFAGRLDHERETVEEKFPEGTELLISDEGTPGWLYEITCELGTTYTFWTYRDDVDGYYKTKIINPSIEDWTDSHGGHVYVRYGRLCLDTRYNNGAPTLEKAYARTVLWATGFSIVKRTGNEFPFSI